MRPKHPVLAAGLLACALAARADGVRVSAPTVSGLDFRVVDLDPPDGVAPAFGVTSSLGSTGIAAAGLQNYFLGSCSDVGGGPGPMTSSNWSPTSFASIESPAGTVEGTTMTVSTPSRTSTTRKAAARPA